MLYSNSDFAELNCSRAQLISGKIASGIKIDIESSTNKII